MELPETPFFVDADPIRLAQVFGNLLNNTSKFSDRGHSNAIATRKNREGRPAGSG